MRSSYKESDVIFLLKDITGMVNPQPTEEREKLIQAGKHYCEMLPIEYVPSEKYMEIYKEALERSFKSFFNSSDIAPFPIHPSTNNNCPGWYLWSRYFIALQNFPP